MLEKTEVYFGEGAPLFRRMLHFKGQGQDEQGEKQEASWATEVTFQHHRRTVTRSFELGLLRSELSRILSPSSAQCSILSSAASFSASSAQSKFSLKGYLSFYWRSRQPRW